ncbi:MAG: DUF3090 family protein [Anaerolineales bacterium]|nr:DUF3090 family protein [Anaerolineales bacterium]
MTPPETVELDHAQRITVDSMGPPGQRTFYLQAAQDETVVTLIIEKEQASALAVVIRNMLERSGTVETQSSDEAPDLIEPLKPLFRVGQLQLSYDEERDMLLVVAEALPASEDETLMAVRIWGTRAQMAALAHKAARVVAAGRSTCPLCHELISPGQPHACVKGNGRKHLE